MTEQVLHRAALEADVDFVWETPVSGVETHPDGVTVVTEAGERLEAAYVVGADGARSSVRSSLEIPLEGPRTENAFVIVDTAEDPDDPLPVERVFHYEHPAMDGRNVLFVPFEGHWRVDLQCRPDDDAEAFSGEAGVQNWLPKVIAPKYAERMTWVSTYVFLQVLAREFIDPHRRVLLVGEAAHLFAPFGARGLNWESRTRSLRHVRLNALGRRGLGEGDRRAAVEHFGALRREAAERNRAASSTALAHLAPRSVSERLRRRAVALAAKRSAKAGRWLDSAPYWTTPRSARCRGNALLTRQRLAERQAHRACLSSRSAHDRDPLAGLHPEARTSPARATRRPSSP